MAWVWGFPRKSCPCLMVLSTEAGPLALSPALPAPLPPLRKPGGWTSWTLMTPALGEQQGLSYRREQKKGDTEAHLETGHWPQQKLTPGDQGVPPGLFQPQAGQAASVQGVDIGSRKSQGHMHRTAQWPLPAWPPACTFLYFIDAVWYCAQHLVIRWWDFTLELVVISFISKGTSQRSQDFCCESPSQPDTYQHNTIV